MAALLAKLSRAFDEDPLIDEYAFVPSADPALFGAAGGGADEGCIAAEHKLAISLEAAVVLYKHAHKRLLALGAAAGWGDAGTAAALAASRAVLLCCADSTGAWDCREALLRAGAVDVEGELRLGALLLRTNHKSGETWAVRRKLLAEALRPVGGDQAAQDRTKALVQSELELVEELAKKYSHHYYAWNHWAWLGRHCASSGEWAIARDLDFPRLAHVTPSHYGLFHHRLGRLRERLVAPGPGGAGSAGGTAAAAGRPEGEEPAAHTDSAAALGLPVSALAAYHEEQDLADSLLRTYAHMEAPWAYRLQLFAALAEAAESAAPAAGVSPEGVRCLGDVWRSETSFATRVEQEPRPQSEAAAQRWARRFRLHALQELAGHLREQAERRRPGSPAREQCLGLAREAMCELERIEASVDSPPAAPAVLRCVRSDLEAVLRPA